MLLFSMFSDNASAQACSTCFTDYQTCMKPYDAVSPQTAQQRQIFDEYYGCTDRLNECYGSCLPSVPTSTATPVPQTPALTNTCSSLPQCGSAVTCFSGSTCGDTCPSGQFQCRSASDIYCCATKTQTPTTAPNIDVPKLVWREVAVCAAVPTSTPDPTAAPTSIPTEAPTPTIKPGDPAATATPRPTAPTTAPTTPTRCFVGRPADCPTELICGNIDSGGSGTCISKPPPTPTPVPCPSGNTCVKDGKNGTCNASGACTANQSTDNAFQCRKQVGTYAGEYACAEILYGSSFQCEQDYEKFQIGSPFTSTSCDTEKPKQGCCKKKPPIPTVAPTATPAPTGSPTPTPTPIPVATLVMALNTQDPTINDESLSANLSLYSLTTNTAVSGAPSSQSFAKTPIRSKKYSANISLTNLPPSKYFIVARRGNMIAKSVFEVKSAAGTIEVPTTTLVFGDINNDDDISLLDSSAFRACWKKPADGACARFDFDKKGAVIDQFDYNTLIQGFAIWNTQGKL